MPAVGLRPQHLHVLGVRELLEAAGHRERLQDGESVPWSSTGPGLATSPMTYTFAASASTTITVTTGLVMYSLSCAGDAVAQLDRA